MYLYVYVDIEYIDMLSYFFNLLRVFYEYIQYVFFTSTGMDIQYISLCACLFCLPMILRLSVYQTSITRHTVYILCRLIWSTLASHFRLYRTGVAHGEAVEIISSAMGMTTGEAGWVCLDGCSHFEEV